jgi:FHA domain-containing protein
MTDLTTPDHAAQPDLDANALLAAFLKGAGMPGVAINWQISPEFMELLGVLLATSVDGTVQLLSERAALKREVSADKTIVVMRNNNPLKFLPDGTAALTQMLRKKMPGFMGPAEAMEDAFEDLAVHQQCMAAGNRAAVDKLLARLAPERSADKRGPSLLDRLLPWRRKAKYWDRYCHRHASVSQAVRADFQEALGAAFSHAYDQQREQLQGG